VTIVQPYAMAGRRPVVKPAAGTRTGKGRSGIRTARRTAQKLPPEFDEKSDLFHIQIVDGQAVNKLVPRIQVESKLFEIVE
jgi:hypothetical protein